MFPVASMDVTNVFDTTEINEIQSVNRKKTGAYAGTVFSQILSTISASNNKGSAKNQVRKKEYFEPMQTNLCIYGRRRKTW